MISDVDTLSRSLLEEAKRFLEKAKMESNDEGSNAYLHAALVLGIAGLEAHINSISEDFLTRELPIHERSILAERTIQIQDGQFVVTEKLKMFRLENRIEFLYRKFSSSPIDKSTWWWSGFKAGMNLRNKLVHPKESQAVTHHAIENILKSIIEMLDVLFKAIYNRSYPLANKGLISTMKF